MTAFWPAISVRSCGGIVDLLAVGDALADAHVEHHLGDHAAPACGSCSRTAWSARRAPPARSASSDAPRSPSARAASFTFGAAALGWRLGAFFRRALRLPPWPCSVSVCVSAIDLNSGALGDAHLLAASPSPTNLKPTRVGLPSLGSASARLDRWIVLSLEMIPPSCCAVWRWWRLTMLMPRTSARSSAGTHLDHFAGAALVAAGEHDDLVALTDLGGH